LLLHPPNFVNWSEYNTETGGSYLVMLAKRISNLADLLVAGPVHLESEDASSD